MCDPVTVLTYTGGYHNSGNTFEQKSHFGMRWSKCDPNIPNLGVSSGKVCIVMTANTQRGKRSQMSSTVMSHSQNVVDEYIE